MFRFRLLTVVEVPRLVSMGDDLCLGSGDYSVEREEGSGRGFICTSRMRLTVPSPFLGREACRGQPLWASAEANSVEVM